MDDLFALQLELLPDVPHFLVDFLLIIQPFLLSLVDEGCEFFKGLDEQFVLHEFLELLFEAFDLVVGVADKRENSGIETVYNLLLGDNGLLEVAYFVFVKVFLFDFALGGKLNCLLKFTRLISHSIQFQPQRQSSWC